MHGLLVLRDLVLLLGVAIPVVAVAQRLRIPAIVGFLLAGIVIGPHGLGLIGRPDAVRDLAEIGVVLLLFTIGLELSLSQLLRMGREVLQGGGLQVGLTLAATALVAWGAGVPPRQAIFLGGLVALSSTAIVLRVFAELGETDSPSGRLAVAILLFQDLLVLPLMLFVPILAGAGRGDGAAMWAEFAESTLVVAVLVAGGKLVIPRFLGWVALVRNRELFTLCIGFIGLGAAYVTSSFGLSLALGSFLAGLVISESEFGLQALSDVRPFRDMFSGIFFTSVGMLLDLGVVAAAPGLVAACAAVVVLLKVVAVTLVVLSLGRTLYVSLVTGLGLAQIGEFSFVLAGVGASVGLLAPRDEQLFLATAVVTMVLAPFLIATSRPVAAWLVRQLGRRVVDRWSYEKEALAAQGDHAIVVGYGLSGRYLVRVLEAAGIPYVVIEQNGRVVRRARAAGTRIVFGDGTQEEVLERVGIDKARVLVVSIDSPADERRIVAVARHRSPDLRIVVRTRYVEAIDELMRLGATEVVVEEFEAALELFARIMEFYEIPSNTIQRELEALRDEHYGMFRGKLHPRLRLDALRHLGIHEVLDLVEVEEGAPAVGHSPDTLEVRHRTGATVAAVVRDGKAYGRVHREFRLRPGDTVVLVGDGEALEKARALFRAPVEVR